MDPRVRALTEEHLGVSIDRTPPHGIRLYASPTRTEVVNNRFVAVRVANSAGALASATPRAVKRLAPALQTMASGELFSTFGIDVLCRALSQGDADPSFDRSGVVYAITEKSDFHSAHAGFPLKPLVKKDIPWAAKEFGLRMAEGDDSPPDDKIWAYACCRADRPVAIAVIRWHPCRVGSVAIVGTKDEHRRRGYGRAVVSAATDSILAQGYAAQYGTIRANIPALRMIRPLGYRLVYETLSV